MRIGDLRERVTIQSATQSRDTFGAVTETWSDVAVVWANVTPLKYTSGVEALVNSQGREVVNTAYTITLRFRTGVTERNKLIWNNTVLDVKRVIDPTGRREWLELLCEVI